MDKLKILVIGGTRFFGVHLARALLREGHEVTIATRGNAQDDFGNNIHRIMVDRSDAQAMKNAFRGKYYDVICDNIAYSSNDVRYLMEAVNCGRYILTSSASVYPELGLDTKESDFNADTHPLIWCKREDYSYDEIKRQAECALYQIYPAMSSAAVRLPYVIGEDDYTKRLYYYVEHIVKAIPMHVDNPSEEIAYIRSSEAGDFIAWLACSELVGPVNACSKGTITLEEIFAYIEKKTGKKPLINPEAEAAPYNQGEAFSLNTGKAEAAGYHFSELYCWIYELLDHFIAEALSNK
jgi:nucleoside-diphosphate-sugar epimerase